jgi:hypothetical protein
MPKRGRPAGFDRGEALQQAMQLFWARGYEGVTLDDVAADDICTRGMLTRIFDPDQSRAVRSG